MRKKIIKLFCILVACLVAFSSCSTVDGFIMGSLSPKALAKSSERSSFQALEAFEIKDYYTDADVTHYYDAYMKEYEEYLNTYGKDSGAYNNEHYAAVQQLADKAEEVYNSYIQIKEQKRLEKLSQTRSTINSLFSEMTEAYNNGDYDKVVSLFNELDSLYSKYENEDLKGTYQTAQDMDSKSRTELKKAALEVWVSSEGYKSLISLIGEEYLDLPIYIGTTKVGFTLREAINSYDFSNDLLDAKAYRAIGVLDFTVYRSFFDYTFEFEIRDSVLCISYVTSNALRVYFSTNPYEIDGALAVVFGL